MHPPHPLVAPLEARYSNYGRFGRGARADALRFATAGKLRTACAALRQGRTFSCQLPAAAGAPADVRTRVLSVSAAPDGVALRAVLLDLPRMARRSRLPDGFAIEPEALDACAERQGVAVEPGDAVLVRSGALGDARSRADWERHRRGPAPGLGLRCAAWLYDREVALVAADTAAVEVRTAAGGTDALALRRIAHAQTGVAFGFDFDLDALARACAEDGEHAFLLVLGPLAQGESDAMPVAIR